MSKVDYNLVGTKFNRLTIISRMAGGWLCKCDCGKSTTAKTSQLKRNNKRSCGCLRVEKSSIAIRKIAGSSKLPPGHNVFNRLYQGYQYDANNRGHIFNLTLEEFRTLTQGNCYYCNTPPITEYYHKNANGPYVANGVDRKNSSLGYTQDNVVSCCKVCNYMKHILPLDQFLTHIAKIHNYRGALNV